MELSSQNKKYIYLVSNNILDDYSGNRAFVYPSTSKVNSVLDRKKENGLSLSNLSSPNLPGESCIVFRLGEYGCRSASWIAASEKNSGQPTPRGPRDVKKNQDLNQTTYKNQSASPGIRIHSKPAPSNITNTRLAYDHFQAANLDDLNQENCVSVGTRIVTLGNSATQTPIHLAMPPKPRKRYPIGLPALGKMLSGKIKKKI